MRWKAKTEKKIGEKRQYTMFLIFPMKFKGYWYWLQDAIVEDWWMGHRWSRATRVVEIPECTLKNNVR